MLLFLNKCDILDKKLEAGIKLADYLSGYAGKPNETKPALNCEWCYPLTYVDTECKTRV